MSFQIPVLTGLSVPFFITFILNILSFVVHLYDMKMITLYFLLPPCNEGFSNSQHVNRGLVKSHKNTIVNLPQTEKLHNLPWLGMNSIDTEKQSIPNLFHLTKYISAILQWSAGKKYRYSFERKLTTAGTLYFFRPFFLMQSYLLLYRFM